MKRNANRLFLIATVLVPILFIGMRLLAQNSSRAAMSPEDVVQAYCKMDAAGERLTVGGWYKAASFFVRAGRPPQAHYVSVVDEQAADRFYRISEDKEQHRIVVAGRTSHLGQIDPFGRFTPIVTPYWLGYSEQPVKQLQPPFIYGPAMLMHQYSLVFTDTHWEFGPKQERPIEVKGPPAWRIEHFEYQPHVALDVAIRYVTKLRDDSRDPAVKQNALKTLEILRRLKVSPRVQRADMKK